MGGCRVVERPRTLRKRREEGRARADRRRTMFRMARRESR